MAPIYVKTVYSFLSSTITIDDLIELAKKNNYQELCICDDNMYGVMEFIRKCNLNNIKPIVGVDFNNNLLFAKNYNGYKNLMKLVTINSKEELSIDNYKEYSKDLILVYKEDSDITKLFKDKYSYKDLNIRETRCLEEKDLETLKYLNMLRDNKTTKDDYEFNDDVCFINDKKEYDFYNLFNLELPLYELNLPDYSKYNDTKGLSNDEYLYNLSVNGLKKRFNNKVSNNYKERLLYELDVIKKMGFSNYFLIVYDFILYAKKNNILVGPGRGSACGSLVSYSLGITDIDPIKYDLLFERFLNIERITMPDIDTDFPDNKRDLVIDYCRNKYGSKKIASIITFDTFGTKSSLRDMGRVMNIPLYNIDTICKLIGNSKDDLKTIYKENNKVKTLVDNDKNLKKLFKVASRIDNIPRHSSIHAAGIVMSDNDLSDTIPLTFNNDGYISSYEAMYLEDLKLLKMDFLGIRNLSIIDECLSLIRNLKFNDIPLDDKKTYELFQKGDTNGIFQFESPGMQNFLRKLLPVEFKDIYNANALYRPGPSDYIPLFLERRKTGRVEYIDDSLKEILSDTEGIIVYQEQIMLIASKMAGFSLGKADILRRAISKKKLELINSLKDEFITGSINNGYTKEVANKVFNDIVKFASYGFNKSHSVAYSVVSYKMAYLKANYPKEFYVSLLNSIGSDLKVTNYIKEMKKKGIKLIKPDINLSTNNWIIKNNNVVLPLNIIKGISNILVNKIIDDREDGYKDIYDFFRKTNYEKNNYMTIIESGILDSFGFNRASLIESLDNLLNYSKLCNDLGYDYVLKPEIKEVDEYDRMALINKEKELYGFYLTNHPISFYKDKYDNIVDLCDIPKYFNKTIDTLVMIDKISIIKTKDKEEMAFITASDEIDTMEYVLFPKVYSEYTNLSKNDIIKVNGKVERRNNYQIIVNTIEKCI